jgi:ribosome biogenesis GTPase / thiamine phosphate phosphatase
VSAIAAALAGLGWDEGWAAAFAREAGALAGARPGDGSVPARVTVEHRGAYEVVSSDGPLWATLTGRLRHAAGPGELPVVGDWVAIAPRPAEQAASIHAVLPRRTAIVRRAPLDHASPVQVLAANVDVVLVATSLNRDLNPRRLERYLATAHESGARPVVALTKIDLAHDPVDIAIAEVALAEVAASVQVIAVSAWTGSGLDAMAELAREGTLALVGSSGVGKSTLINALAGESLLATSDIREDDARGRHTTSRRQLVALPGGGCLLDTPGLRELGLWGDEAGLASAFSDVEGLAAGCRFADCAHEREPGCAVTAAVATGELAADRFAGWQKLRREERHVRLEQDALARREERRRWAVIGRAGAVRAAVKRGEWQP